MTTEITIRRPDDFHVHLRDGELLGRVLLYTAKVFGRALVMPNISPPVLTGTQAMTYCNRIMDHLTGGDLKALWHQTFYPLMTIKLTVETTPEMIASAKRKNVVAAKLYPAGVTTNSADGISDFDSEKLHAVLEAMAERGMVLSIHGETPGKPALDAEAHFAEKHLIPISQRHPKLKIVLEHVTTRLGCRIVRTLPRVAGTITAHHLLMTIDDVIGGKLNPHCFCKPVAKTEDDRQAIIEAATSGLHSFFFGSDSAPHITGAKSGGAAGCFTAPYALPLLAQVFEEAGALDNLEVFTSSAGAEFYGLPLNEGRVRLVKKTNVIPDIVSVGIPYATPPRGYENPTNLVPFWAGKEIQWEVADVIHERADTDTA